GKWTLYEGGIRVPFLVVGPGIEAGSQCDVPIVGWDLLATFAELAGEAPASSGVDTDGSSSVSLLRGETDRPVVRINNALVFHRYNEGHPHSAVIDGDYKLLKFWKSGKVELYNLKEDRGETHDIAGENPGKVKELAAEMTAYFRKVNPDLLTRYQ